MFHRKMILRQIEEGGVRLGDSCSIVPSHGRRKEFTLNRKVIDLVSHHFRPDNLSMAYVELPQTSVNPFHYRLELEDIAEGRFVLKTLKGQPFWVNGLAAREAYIERADKLFLDEHKMNFDCEGLKALTENHFEHPVLSELFLMQSDLRILIEGETGTGKSHLAGKIHEKSGRSGPYVAVNLSSFNPQLIESELFGHKKGAFTGALSDKEGALRTAHYGTLFLDEIDSLPLDLQTKLLTFLDSGKFRRVGDVKEQTVNTRLVFASGRDLSQLVERGEFRRDLYFRLKAGHTMALTPLRNEPKKVREACQAFALINNVSLTVRLVEFYETLAWPGNLRQLLGHLEKKKVLSRSTKLDFDGADESLLLESSDLVTIGTHSEIVPLDQHKRDYVKKAFSVCEGNVALTARKLQINERTVRTLIS
ncbi:MAG: sigma 54-interacting transcriptional regulator [Bacteriovoracaceae bacterium]